jgi:hypothetical protein
MSKLLKLDRHLTQDAFGHLALSTYEGMAHFAGTGPAGKTCRMCKFWCPPAGARTHLYGSQSSKNGTRLKSHSCLKHRQLGGTSKEGVPPETSACKYFESAPNPPPLFAPRCERAEGTQ